MGETLALGPGLTRIPSRKTRKLSELLDKRIGAYALAASAAGVGILASASPAKADTISYTTPNQLFSGPGFLSFSLGGDTFRLTNSLLFQVLSAITTSILTQGGKFRTITIPVGYNFGSSLRAVASGPGAGVLANPVAAGAVIGPQGTFTTQAFIASNKATVKSLVHYFGPVFNGSHDALLGLQFEISGNFAYGWAEVQALGIPGSRSTFTGPSIQLDLVALAYDSCPGQAITAGETSNNVTTCPPVILPSPINQNPPATTPEPGTLGLLSIGAAGLALWRKRVPKPKAE
jgi:hypothetical protein